MTYTTVAVSTSPPTCSPSSSLLALEARWMASSLLATGSGLVFFGMLTLHEAGQWGGSSACWRTEPCGEVLRHAGVGRVQVEAGSWRRWGSGVGGRGGAGGVPGVALRWTSL